MSGSVDLNTNRGIILLLLMCFGSAFGGAATFQKFFGPGGNWEQMVAQQAVYGTQLENVTKVLDRGFKDLTSAQKEAGVTLNQIQRTIDAHEREIEYINVRLINLEDMYNRPPSP